MAGEAAAAGEVEGVRENHFFLAGEAEAAGDAAGDADAVAEASFFLDRFGLAGLGDTAGEAAVAAVAAGEAAFLARLCLAGVADASGLTVGSGVCATNVTAENTANTVINRVNLLMGGEIKALRSMTAMTKCGVTIFS